MAESRRYGLNAQLDADIEQILQEAQHRWLRPAEICEILQNYQKFQIAREPQDRPPSGSLFLFDRRVLRYFRKDGHNWRKKKDGKTVKEAHERLKAGSVDVLHCYYAHGEDNENFQRRSYWMLEEELSHIVLVHYREVKRNRTYFNHNREAAETIPVQENEGDLPYSEVDSSLSSKIQPQDHQITSQITATASLSSAQASEYEDVESAYNHKKSSGFHSFLESQQPLMRKVEDGFSPYYPVPTSSFHPNCPYYEGQFSATFDMNLTLTSQGDREKNRIGTSLAYGSGEPLDFPSWNNVLEDSTFRDQSVHFPPSSSTTPSSAMSMAHGQGNEILAQVRTDGLGTRQEFGSNGDHLKEWQNSLELYAAPPGQSTHQMQNDLQLQVTDAEGGSCVKPELDSNLIAEERADYSSLKQPLLDGLRGGLKKLDSFDRWMSKELGDVDQSHIQSSSGTYWEAVENQGGVGDSSRGPQVQLDSYLLGPSLSQDQYFSIIDFSPNWVYAGSEVKVLIMGRFLKSQQEVEKSKWACMFGELEVPADVIADGVLRCHTPVNKAGRVPFYVTCSNRLACSEVREFEFRVSVSQDKDVADASIGPSIESLLLVRFTKLLSFGSSNSPTSISRNEGDTSTLSNKISSYEWEQMLKHTFEEKFSTEKMKDQLLQKLLKEKLQHWLLQKTAKGGKGPSVLDKDGQGVLHLAAALGYDWAIPPTIAAGVSVNFRDVNGWTALHWAASYGREQTVGVLISLGAAAGALTDPTPKYTSGRTPADLASSNGHKGIAGYLAESALSSHLSSLKLKDKKEGNNGETYGIKAVQTVSERTATLMGDGDLPLKDSLAAVRNATQAAARIHQVFRAESFQRKQLDEYRNGKFGMSDERVLSLLAVKTNRAGQHDEPVHAAAIRIQNKFRSWKGRKEFLLTRQRIIKIQAHFRGHQVRRNYKKIIWSVGILEKVILRWRRKGSGLRGFRPETNTDYPSMQNESLKEDEYDFLKEGRKQTEERLQKALARVKSMVQYPEARDQYRRLLNVVSELRSLPATSQTESLWETKDLNVKVMNNCGEAADFDEDLVDVQTLLGDDTFMSTTL